MMGPVLVLLLLAVISGNASTVTRATVTNEDIRDAILQIVKVVRVVEDKLERHEYRERVLGEQLKKGLVAIDKRIKLLEPFKGTISRLDQRLAAVETILMQKDDHQKTFDIVEDIHNNLPVVVDKLKSDILDKLADLKSAPPTQVPIVPAPATKVDLDLFQKNIENKITQVGGNIKTIEADLGKIREDNSQIRDVASKSSENLDKVKRQLNSSEQLLEKYETKLAEYNNRIPEVTDSYKDKSEWHTGFLQAFDQQKSHVEQILSEVKSLGTTITAIPTKTDLADAHNTTRDVIALLRHESSPQKDIQDDPSSNSKVLDLKLQQLSDDIKVRHEMALKSIREVSDDVRAVSGNLNSSYRGIKSEIENLGKVEQVMVQTADNVLDTKRRVEYGVHQIIAEVQKMVEDSSKDVNSAISERFDTFEMSILDEESGALANLTTKISAEIDQVWRQIGIMHQQITASTGTLNKLQNQTDAYVNGSLNVMDNVKGKVGTITGRITEVDENLNFLIGKLSLVTQEFNQIRTGLTKALDEMRGSYKTIHEKIREGSGPHPLE